MRLLRELGGERFLQSEKGPIFKRVAHFHPAILIVRLVTLQMEALRNAARRSRNQYRWHLEAAGSRSE
jgi:hypothetical protein